MTTRKNISRIRIAKDVMRLELSPPAKVLMLQMKIHDDSDPYIAGNKAALTRSETALALVELRVKNIIEEHGKTWRFKSEWL